MYDLNPEDCYSRNQKRPLPSVTDSHVTEAHNIHQKTTAFNVKRILLKCPSNFEVLQVTLKLLRLLGLAPYSYNEVDGRYSFGWTSLPIMLALLVSTLAGFVMFIFLTHIGLKKFYIYSRGCAI